MKDKKVSSIIILITFILIILGIIVFININQNNNDDIKLVDDYTTFFTIDGCINRYIGYISDGENNKLLNVLNKKYIEENNINQNNIIEIIDDLNIRNNNIIFKSLKMYEKNNSGKIEYYVFGKVYSEDIDGINYLKDYYVTVTVNKNKETFDITPYDGKVFKGGNLNEIK